MNTTTLVIGATGNIGKELTKLGYTAEISNTVEEITGPKAISFETFAKDYKEVLMG